MITVHKVKQGSKEWHELRKGRLTASNAAVLLARGINAAVNNGKDSGSGYWAERGKTLEKQAIEIYEAVKGVKVLHAGFVTNTDYPDCGYSPDGFKPRLIEVKCFAEEKHLKCLEEIPTTVYAQAQFGMMIAESDECDVVFYNPDIEDNSLCFKVITVKRDEQLIARFRKILGIKQ
jgi:YqaJ-like viral recombinase domain